MLTKHSLEDRCHIREPVEINSRLQKGSGLGPSVIIADLSDYGCRILSIPNSLRRRDQVALRMMGYGPFLSQVKGLHLGKEAGLHFDTPIHSAVFNQVLANHRAAATMAGIASEFLMVLRGELDRLRN